MITNIQWCGPWLSLEATSSQELIVSQKQLAGKIWATNPNHPLKSYNKKRTPGLVLYSL
jgi:hypothetical protein